MHGWNGSSVYLVSSVFNKNYLCASAPLRFFIISNCASAWAHKRKALENRFRFPSDNVLCTSHSENRACRLKSGARLRFSECKIIFFLSPSERFPPLVLQTSPTFSAFLRFSPIFSEQWFSHLL